MKFYRHHAADPINIHAQKHQDYLNSLWLIAITFLSVGYGKSISIKITTIAILCL